MKMHMNYESTGSRVHTRMSMQTDAVLTRCVIILSRFGTLVDEVNNFSIF